MTHAHSVPAEGDEVPEHPVPVAFGLGSNLGERPEYLAAGLAALHATIEVTAVSSIWVSAPVGYLDQPDFLNAVVVGTTRMAPRALLAVAQEAESAAGRQRLIPNGPRTLDIDLLLYGELRTRMPGLILPHPRWRERSFVLAPLNEVAAAWLDPESGASVADITAALARSAGAEWPKKVAGSERLTEPLAERVEG